MCKMFQAHRPSEDRSIAGRLSPIDPNRGYPGPLADHPITGLGLYPDTMSLIARLNTFGYFFYTIYILKIVFSLILQILCIYTLSIVL